MADSNEMLNISPEGEGVPLDKRKLILGFPLYKQVPAAFFMNYLNMDKREVVYTIATNGVYTPTAMQQMVNSCLKITKDDTGSQWERLVVMEHDMIPQEDGLTRMAGYGPDKHIVCAMYFQHYPPHLAIAMGPKNDGSGSVMPIGPDIVKVMANTPGLYEVSAVGLGFTAIHRDVLEQWDRSVPMFSVEGNMSHDVWFCLRAREQGFNVFVDSGIQSGHLTEAAIGIHHNQQMTSLYRDLYDKMGAEEAAIQLGGDPNKIYEQDFWPEVAPT
jgi:hypothetical protein